MCDISLTKRTSVLDRMKELGIYEQIRLFVISGVFDMRNYWFARSKINI